MLNVMAFFFFNTAADVLDIMDFLIYVYIYIYKIVLGLQGIMAV